VTFAAWLTLAAAAVSCVTFAARYMVTVRTPGRRYRAERHYMMVTAALAEALVLAAAVLLALDAPIAAACLALGGVVTVAMVWRTWLLHRSQHDGKQK